MMKSALVLFAHGARDPEWSVPFRNIQTKLAARCPEVAVELAFLELMPPALSETVERLAASGHDRITVAPMFMAQGGHVKRDVPRLVAELRECHPHIALELLPAVGEVEAVLDAITDWLVNSVKS
ncbi:MAG: CbiX/SirB N-terminal domain-containing protein [Betaproteobacteria bacterium]|nr:CbiX/SirB N-terminal domain-containing protein [Betaproteobacteria bacterium]